jgi:hypothetical protein
MVATDVGAPRTEYIQPNRNPHTGLYARLRYAYVPPASGSAAPNSAAASAPNKLSVPPTIHTSITSPADPVPRAISPGTIKIPVPIIVPTTIAAAAQLPSPRTSSPAPLTFGDPPATLFPVAALCTLCLRDEARS